MGKEGGCRSHATGSVGEIPGLGALSMHHSFIHALTCSFPPLILQQKVTCTYVYTHIYGIIILNNQKVETIQVVYQLVNG